MNGKVESPRAEASLGDAQAVKDVRKLVIDICRQNNGGHGGSAIGMAPMAVALWRHTMRFNPLNPEWFDRDRFVLSNGHAAMLQYAMLHVAGYPHMTMDELKLYGSAKAVDRDTGTWTTTICHAHPEIEVPGVEVTTGPLGQGVANAVGLAIASKNMAETFNKQDLNLLESRVYCVTGDGCLQEGLANEAMAIAGHLGLDNLVLLYDNNQVTCDGPLDWIMSEDTNAKAKAMGWHVIDVMDGDSDLAVAGISKALEQAKRCKGKPTLINIRTTIGFGTSTAGTFKRSFLDLVGNKVHHIKRAATPDAPIFAIYGDSLQEVRLAYMTTGNGVGFELFEFIDPSFEAAGGESDFSYNRGGVFHFCVTDKEPDVLAGRLVGAGGNRVGTTVKLSGNVTCLYVKDPWGNVIEILDHSFERLTTMDTLS